MTKPDISKTNLAAHEWMGLRVHITGGTDRSRTGMRGRVVGETKNTLTIETTRGEKTVPKKEVVMTFFLPDQQQVALDLALWCYRPEDRIKVFAKKRK